MFPLLYSDASLCSFSAQFIFKSQNHLGQRWTSAEKKNTAPLSRGRTARVCQKIINAHRWFLVCSQHLEEVCGTQPKRTTCPADSSCSSFLLSPGRCFPKATQEPRPSPATRGSAEQGQPVLPTPAPGHSSPCPRPVLPHQHSLPFPRRGTGTRT